MNELEDLHGRLDELAKSLKPHHLKFAIGILEHGQVTKAYVDAGFSEKSAGKNAYHTYNKIAGIREYVLTAQLMASRNSQANLDYNENVWLADILEARDIALGRKEAPVMFFGESKMVKAIHLSTFAKLSEQLGKKLGIFKETLDLNAKGVMKQIPADADPQAAAQAYQDLIRCG